MGIIQRVSNTYKLLTDKNFKKRLAFAKLAFNEYDRAIFGIITSTEYCGGNPFGDEEMVASRFRIGYFGKESLKYTSLPLRPISCESGGTRPAQYPGGGGQWRDRRFLTSRTEFEQKLQTVAYELHGVNHD